MFRHVLRATTVLALLVGLGVVGVAVYLGYFLDVRRWSPVVSYRAVAGRTTDPMEQLHLPRSLGATSNFTVADIEGIATELRGSGMCECYYPLANFLMTRVVRADPDFRMHQLEVAAQSPLDKAILALNRWRLPELFAEQDALAAHLAGWDYHPRARERATVDALWDRYESAFFADLFRINERVRAKCLVAIQERTRAIISIREPTRYCMRNHREETVDTGCDLRAHRLGSGEHDVWLGWPRFRVQCHVLNLCQLSAEVYPLIDPVFFQPHRETQEEARFRIEEQARRAAEALLWEGEGLEPN